MMKIPASARCKTGQACKGVQPCQAVTPAPIVKTEAAAQTAPTVEGMSRENFRVARSRSTSPATEISPSTDQRSKASAPGLMMMRTLTKPTRMAVNRRNPMGSRMKTAARQRHRQGQRLHDGREIGNRHLRQGNQEGDGRGMTLSDGAGAATQKRIAPLGP